MSEKSSDKADEIPETLYDPNSNKTYKRLRFFGKVSDHWLSDNLVLEIWWKLTNLIKKKREKKIRHVWFFFRISVTVFSGFNCCSPITLNSSWDSLMQQENDTITKIHSNFQEFSHFLHWSFLPPFFTCELFLLSKTQKIRKKREKQK